MKKALKTENKWTGFYDMYSGGDAKLDWECIYIEAAREEACVIFKRKFHREPDNVTCECCGEDYYVQEYDSLEKATKNKRMSETVESYIKCKDVLVIYQNENSK